MFNFHGSCIQSRFPHWRQCKKSTFGLFLPAEAICPLGRIWQASPSRSNYKRQEQPREHSLGVISALPNSLPTTPREGVLLTKYWVWYTDTLLTWAVLLRLNKMWKLCFIKSGLPLGKVEHHLTYSSLWNVCPFFGDSIIRGTWTKGIFQLLRCKFCVQVTASQLILYLKSGFKETPLSVVPSEGTLRAHRPEAPVDCTLLAWEAGQE